MSMNFGDRTTAVEEIAVGAAETAADVVRNPVGSARRQVRAFERKGTPAVRQINRRINRRINALMPGRLPGRLTVFGVEVNDKLPEKLAIKGLHAVRGQARRDDLVGGVAKRTLSMFNGSFKTIARTATRLEEASQLAPHSQASSKPVARRARRRSTRRRAA